MAEYSYLLTDIKAPVEWLQGDITVGDLKSVLLLSIATMEHKIIIGEIETDADVVVRFEGLDTKLIVEEDGYFFEKLNPTTNVEYQVSNLNKKINE